MKSMFVMGTALAGGLLACASMTFANVAFAQDEDGDEPTFISASLSGSEVKGGNEDVSGMFEGEIDLSTGQICYFVDAYEVKGATAAHIHEGAKGTNGAPVVTLELSSEDDEDDKCTSVDTALLKKIIDSPSSYYVQVHSKSKPAGAIRGQLEE